MRIDLPGEGLLRDSALLDSLVVDDGRPDITLCIPNPCKLHPMTVAIVASLLDSAVSEGNVVLVECGDDPPMFLADLVVAGLVPDPPKARATSESAGRRIRVQRIGTQKELGNFVTDFVPLLHAEEDVAATTKYVLLELIRNVLEHSGSDRGAFAAAEVGEEGEIMVGVADAGIGVAPSIRRSHSAPSVEEAVKLAFAPGISGTTSQFGGNETNGGAGLFFMKAMASLSDREMVMITESTMMRVERQPSSTKVVHASLDDDNTTWASFPTKLVGTAVGVDLLINDTVGFKRLLSEIGAVYHLSVRKQKSEHRKARFR